MVDWTGWIVPGGIQTPVTGIVNAMLELDPTTLVIFHFFTVVIYLALVVRVPFFLIHKGYSGNHVPSSDYAPGLPCRR